MVSSFQQPRNARNSRFLVLVSAKIRCPHETVWRHPDDGEEETKKALFCRRETSKWTNGIIITAAQPAPQVYLSALSTYTSKDNRDDAYAESVKTTDERR